MGLVRGSVLMSSQKFIVGVLTISLVVTSALAQEPRPPNDEVVHVTTDLVQTGVVLSTNKAALSRD